MADKPWPTIGCHAMAKVVHVRDSCAREPMHSCACTDAHADINTRRLICLRDLGSCSLCSSSASRRILVVVVREQMHIPNLAFTLALNLSQLNLDPRTVTGGFNLLRNQSYCSATPTSHSHVHTHARARAHTQPPPQRSCRDPEISSKVLLTHA